MRVDRQRERGTGVTEPRCDDCDRYLTQVHQCCARMPGIVHHSRRWLPVGTGGHAPTKQARSGGGWALCPLVDRVENSQGLFERLGRSTSLSPERMVEPVDKE